MGLLCLVFSMYTLHFKYGKIWVNNDVYSRIVSLVAPATQTKKIGTETRKMRITTPQKQSQNRTQKKRLTSSRKMKYLALQHNLWRLRQYQLLMLHLWQSQVWLALEFKGKTKNPAYMRHCTEYFDVCYPHQYHMHIFLTNPVQLGLLLLLLLINSLIN